MWVALDDVNYTKADLSDEWPEGSDDDNAVITNAAEQVARHGGDPEDPESGPDASYSLTDVSIPIDGVPMGYPAIKKWVKKVYHIELAEIQIWDKKLNTSIEANRRLLITDKGKPETDYSKVDAVLGKPKVRIHGSNALRVGLNTGTLGIDDAEHRIPEGQFVPGVGKIKRYRPDPSLHGPQKPGDPPDTVT